MNDILETEFEILKDERTRCIKNTLKNGKEIILYSPKYVERIEKENSNLSSAFTELEKWLEINDIGVQLMGSQYVLDEIKEIRRRYK